MCIINNGYLESIDESVIERVDGVIHATSLVTNREYTIDSNTKVSMNMMSFTPSIFKYLEDKFKEFLDENKDNLEKCEYLIPTVLANGIKDGKFNVTVLNTNSKWVGVTYKEDKESVVNYINKLINSGEYNKDLWG